MTDFVLVHGSGHGAWCWREVLPALASRGHTARAIDLPGLGEDRTPPSEVTLGATVERIGGALSERSLLVGHSLGGIVVAQASEAWPERIVRAVYVAALVPGNGQSAGDVRRSLDAPALAAAMRTDAGGQTTSFDTDAVPDLLYHDCPPAAVAFALSRLRPQPVGPARAPVTLTARAGRVPRSYVRCRADRAIPLAAQERMSAGWEDVHEIDCGHSPFFAAPDKLADILVAIGEAAS